MTNRTSTIKRKTNKINPSQNRVSKKKLIVVALKRIIIFQIYICNKDTKRYFEQRYTPKSLRTLVYLTGRYTFKKIIHITCTPSIRWYP